MTLEEAKKEIENWICSCGDAYSISHNPKEKAAGDALSDVLGLLNEIEPELSRNPGQLTLTELAREMRRLFKFEYLTCEFYGGSKFYFICFWNGKPRWRGGSWWLCDNCDLIGDIKLHMKFAEPNLSEYTDADGIIDYSKCIVEVSDDAE